MTLRFTSCNLCNGEFDAAAHRVDPLRSYAHAVSEVPRNFFELCSASTTRSRRAAPPFASGERDYGVIALAKNNPRARGIFESVYWQQAFDEHFEQLDEAAEFLHRDNQRLVFLAEMRFHELRRLPVHQL